MKVLVAGGLPSSLINFRWNLLCDLQDAGCVVLAAAGGDDEDTSARLAGRGICYLPMALARQGTNIRQDMRYLGQFRSILQREKPDIVLSYTIKPVIYGGIAASRERAVRFFPMITGLGYAFGTGSAKQKLVNRAVRQLYKRALRRAKTVIFQNQDDRDLFDKAGLKSESGSTLVVNGSGVDLAHFKRQPLPSGPTTFLLVARLLRGKGIEDFVDAARLLKPKYPQLRFLLVGGSDENPESIPRAKAEAWDREGVIEYRGELKDVRPAFAECHVFVLPSYYREGTPRTILEAFASGRTVITCDVPGCRQTVEPGRVGWLTQPRDPAALAAAMETYHLDPSRINRESELARERAEEKYEVHKVNRVILDAMGLP